MEQAFDDSTARKLVARALAAKERAYAPYSRFRVGAAVLAASGEMYDGANVENASYPAGICAERAAIARAVSDGERRLVAIAVCGGPDGPAKDYCFPCGVCRQVMREFCDPKEFTVSIAKSADSYETFTLDELLPKSFGPESIGA